MAIIKSQFVFHPNNQPVTTILKTSINKGITEESIIKEELIINDLSGDSDLEVASYFDCNDFNKRKNSSVENLNDESTLSVNSENGVTECEEEIALALSDDDLEVASYFQSENDQAQNESYRTRSSSPHNLIVTQENSTINYEESACGEIIELSLTDDDEVSNITNIESNEKIVNHNNQNNDSSMVLPTSVKKKIISTTISNDSADKCELSEEDMEVNLESDEECVMYDLSNYSADDILKLVNRNELIENENLFNVKIKNTTKKVMNQISDDLKSLDSSTDFASIQLINKNTSEINSNINFNLAINGNNSNINNCSSSDYENGNSEEEIIGSTIRVKNVIKSCNIPVNSEQHVDRISSPDENVSIIISDVNNDFKSDGVTENDKNHPNAEKVLTPYEIMKSVIIRHCKKCKTIHKVTETELDERCKNCRYKFLYKCSLCSVSFYNLKVTRSHVFKFHEQVLLKNNNVPPPFINYVGTTNSQSVSEGLNPLKRNSFNIVNSKQSSLSSIVNKHEEMSNFDCKFCNANVKSKNTLIKHLIKEHEDKINVEELKGIIHDNVIAQRQFIDSSQFSYCVECQKIIPGTSIGKCETCRLLPNIIKKKQTSLRKKRFPCIVCARVFISKNSLQQHLNLGICHNAKARFCCADCSFVASDIKNFSKHLNTFHAKKTLFKCNFCLKLFESLSWLEEHKNLHCIKNKEVLNCAHCTFKCYKKSKIKDHLRCAHMQLYTEKRLFCEKCGSKWSNIYKFNDHIGICSKNYDETSRKFKGLILV